VLNIVNHILIPLMRGGREWTGHVRGRKTRSEALHDVTCWSAAFCQVQCVHI